MNICPFCELLHDPTKTNCNDQRDGSLIRRAGPIREIEAAAWHLQMAETPPPLTCTQLLEHARDSMDAALDELRAANKLANGLTSLLLLDMISETGTMAARIRAVIAAASNEATAFVFSAPQDHRPCYNCGFRADEHQMLNGKRGECPVVGQTTEFNEASASQASPAGSVSAD